MDRRETEKLAARVQAQNDEIRRGFRPPPKSCDAAAEAVGKVVFSRTDNESETEPEIFEKVIGLEIPMEIRRLS
jgi:hypothetical protein